MSSETVSELLEKEIASLDQATAFRILQHINPQNSPKTHALLTKCLQIPYHYYPPPPPPPQPIYPTLAPSGQNQNPTLAPLGRK